ncbi:MAG TPA: hypothetical protein VF458_10540 [Ktedonobacteraceae bacterium]
MRVYGLSSSVKSLGWLLGLTLSGLIVLYPPMVGISYTYLWPFYGEGYSWRFNILYNMKTGGLAWHLLGYLHRSPYGYMSGYSTLAQCAPFLFVAVLFPLCAWLFWRRLVDYAERPTILRGMLSALLALGTSLVLTFLLDQAGGRIVLNLVNISLPRNLEIRAMISTIWITVVVQTALFALPTLVLGGLLAWLQGQREARFRARRPVLHVTREE